MIDSPGRANADMLQKEIEADIEMINQHMSTWDENAEISQLSRSSTNDWFVVGKDFAVVDQEAKRIHKLSVGALDPALAPLIDVWGLGVAKRQRTIPSIKEISNALMNAGMQHLEVRTDPPAIRKAIPGLRLTLSSMAPGYAVDEFCRIFRSHGLSSIQK